MLAVDRTDLQPHVVADGIAKGSSSMREEELDPDRSRTAPAGAQPPYALAGMTAHLRAIQIGNVLAVLAAAASVGAVLTFPPGGETGTGLGAAITALVSSLLLLAVCGFQLLAWRRVMAQLRGEHDRDVALLTRISWFVHLGSYLPVLVALWACIAASVAAGVSSTSGFLLGLALLAMLGAQSLAGVQYVRASGPPGTIPAHLRQLSRRRLE
jgi:hypothetical protein